MVYRSSTFPIKSCTQDHHFGVFTSIPTPNVSRIRGPLVSEEKLDRCRRTEGDCSHLIRLKEDLCKIFFLDYSTLKGEYTSYNLVLVLKKIHFPSYYRIFFLYTGRIGHSHSLQKSLKTKSECILYITLYYE